MAARYLLFLTLSLGAFIQQIQEMSFYGNSARPTLRTPGTVAGNCFLSGFGRQAYGAGFNRVCGFTRHKVFGM
jgi:hypothetical protein